MADIVRGGVYYCHMPGNVAELLLWTGAGLNLCRVGLLSSLGRPERLASRKREAEPLELTWSCPLQKIYPWRRYWVRADTELLLEDDAYLPDPAEDFSRS